MSCMIQSGPDFTGSENYGADRWLPVALVAQSMTITPRRVRALLSSGRLVGRQHDNGYWVVAYPYQFTFGKRGPCLKVARPKPVVVKEKKPQRPLKWIHETEAVYLSRITFMQQVWLGETLEQFRERMQSIIDKGIENHEHA